MLLPFVLWLLACIGQPVMLQTMERETTLNGLPFSFPYSLREPKVKVLVEHVGIKK
jgi:hypothetical protein